MLSQNRPERSDASAADVLAHALRLLTRREHARLELQRKLVGKGYVEALVAEVIERLLEDDLLSDTRYAGALARTRLAQGHGPMRIRADLRQQQLDEAEIDTALEALEVDWDEQARQVRERRFGAGLPESYAVRVKQARFLSARGFASWQCRAACEARSGQ